MKRIALLLTLTLWTLLSIAALRTPEEAAAIAGQFFAAQQVNMPAAQRIQPAKIAALTPQPRKLVYTQSLADSDQPAFYVFNEQDADGGFVLVAADDRARTILGYSDTGDFLVDHMPDHIRFWFGMYTDELTRLADLPEDPNALPAPLHRVASVQATTYPTIAPLLGNTVWGQGEPFNNQCPIVNGQRCVTGCVATAMSQIMYYHRYPTRGTGSNSYECNGTTYSADFSQSVYDWDNMIPSYNASYTSEQANAVAKLMSDVGIASNMGYSPTGSGTSDQRIFTAITDFFGYDHGYVQLHKDYMSEAYILEQIAAELQAKRPLYISGATVNNEGHAFVCDGMQENGYLHINWGWNGYSDGYFAFSALDPDNQGVGGSATDAAFTEWVTVYAGIRPDQGGQLIPSLCADDIELMSNTRIEKTEPIYFLLTGLYNLTVHAEGTWRGDLCYVLYQDDQPTHIIPARLYEELTLYPYTGYPELAAAASLSDIPSGSYVLSVAATWSGSDGFIPLNVRSVPGSLQLPVTITNDSVWIDAPQVEYTNINLDFTAGYMIDYAESVGQNLFSIDLYTPDYQSSTTPYSGSRLMFGVVTNDRNSIIGTYRLGDGSLTPGSIYTYDVWSALEYANGDTFVRDSYTDAVLSITQDQNNNYIFATHFTTPKARYTIVDTLAVDSMIIGKVNPAEDRIDHSMLTNETVTALSSADAKALIAALPEGETTPIPYLIHGIVSRFMYSSSQAVRFNTYRFYISDDGTRTDDLYAYTIQGLYNQPPSTDLSTAVGDTVVLYAALANPQSGTDRLVDGHIYRHTPKSTSTSLQTVAAADCSISVDHRTIHVTSPAPADMTLIDLTGQIISYLPHTSQATLTAPSAGVYLLRCGTQTTKILIP